MPISHTHRTIFIHIPKCAGTTIECIFKMNTFDQFYSEILDTKILRKIPQDKFTDEEYRLCASKNMQHYTFRELSKILDKHILDSYKKISIVRNPYDRLVSEFHFCASGLKKGKTFEHFVKSELFLQSHFRNWLYDGHLETQTSFLINENGNFKCIDKIYRFEDLNICLNEIKTLTGNYKNYHAWKSTRKDMEWYYNDELKEIVYNFYKEDFINFNYSR